MTRCGGPDPTATSAGAALIAPRPLTVTERPPSSTTVAGASVAGTRAGDGGGSRPGQGPAAGWGPVDPLGPLQQLHGGGRHRHDPLGRPPASPPLGHRDRLRAQQARQPGRDARRPLGLPPVPTPEAELAALVGHHLDGHEAQRG